MNKIQIPFETTTHEIIRINFVIQSRKVSKLPRESKCMRSIIKLLVLHCSCSICLHNCSFNTQKWIKFTVKTTQDQHYIKLPKLTTAKIQIQLNWNKLKVSRTKQTFHRKRTFERLRNRINLFRARHKHLFIIILLSTKNTKIKQNTINQLLNPINPNPRSKS